MNLQEQAVVDIAKFLARLRVPYMIIGGIANAVWGLPRSTVDVDCTVWVEEEGVEDFVRQVSENYEITPSEPLAFMRDTRVLPVKTAGGVAVDIIFAMVPFELEAIGRAVTRKVAGTGVRFCTAEDLVLYKIVSEREQDILDVRGLIRVRKGQLDREYLDARVKKLAEIMERPGIQQIYRDALEQ